jgi:hypothetical protein
LLPLIAFSSAGLIMATAAALNRWDPGAASDRLALWSVYVGTAYLLVSPASLLYGRTGCIVFATGLLLAAPLAYFGLLGALGECAPNLTLHKSGPVVLCLRSTHSGARWIPFVITLAVGLAYVAVATAVLLRKRQRADGDS